MGVKWGEDSPERVRAVQERRRSSAAGSHGDRRHKRRRARDAQRREAIREGREA